MRLINGTLQQEWFQLTEASQRQKRALLLVQGDRRQTF